MGILMTLNQKIASFQLSYILALIDHMKSREKPKTALWNRLNGLEDQANKALDHYRIHRMSRGDLDRASKLFDRLDQEIAWLYPTSQRRRQIRREKRHKQCRVRRTIRTAH